MEVKLLDRILTLGNLIANAKLAYIEADLNFQVLSWNAGAKNIFGYSEEETMGQYLYKLVPITRSELDNCQTTQYTIVEYISSDGEKIPCDLFYTPIMNTNLERVGTAILCKDIRSRLKDKATLKEKEQILQDIAGFAPIGIFHANLEGRIDSANPEFAWMLGIESSQAVTEQITDFATQVFYDEKEAEDFMFRIFEAEEVKRFRCRLKKTGNSFGWILFYAKSTHDEEGRRSGFNGFAIDISDTVRAEQGLQKANEKLHLLSVMDGLTGIPNRRKFDQFLESEWSRNKREKTHLSVILSDIDFFKFYNDTYGHQAGDECLVKVATEIKESLQRASDLAARYGGEEFAVILPNTDLAGALAVAESVRKNVENLNILHKNSKVCDHVTLSLGVSSVVPNNENSSEQLVLKADEALYEAKENGRNQVNSKD